MDCSGALVVATLFTFVAWPGTAAGEPRPLSITLSPGVDCPGAAGLQAAFARLGRPVDPRERAGVRLEVLSSADGVRVLLSTPGRILLDRALPAADCAALAEAIAYVVDRRLAGIEWEGSMPAAAPHAAPPRALPPRAVPPAPASRSRPAPARPGAAAGALRIDAAFVAAQGFDVSRVAPGAALAVRVRLAHFLELALGAAWIAHGSFAAGPGSARLDELPLQAGVLALWRRGRVELGGEARLRLAALFASGRGLDHDARATGVSLRAGPVAWLGAELARGLWVASSLAGMLLVRGNDVVVEGLGTIAEESPLSFEWTLGLGYRPGAL